MKKILFIAILAIAGWLTSQAQTLPANEKYNEYIEQASLMAEADPAKGAFLMNATMEALSKDPKAYRQMMELAERRFSDAADPIHNEALYMAVLKHATENFVLSGAEIERQRLLLEGAKKNMEGSIATDFDYVTPKDKTVRHLKELKADYILIYFNNPDCTSCETVKERLASNELINQMVKDKKLIVLAIYPYNDKKLWSKANYPSMMINGWNQSQQIEYAELYDLPTLPCFYLLDQNYTVLMKNEGSLNKVEARLKKLMTPAEAAPATQPANKPKTNIKAAPAGDPMAAKSEELLGYLIGNQSQELYNNMSDEMQAKLQPSTLDGSFAQVESRAGKYQNHDAWEIQEMPNNTIYTSLLHFENGKMRILISYNQAGKMSGINLIPVGHPAAPASR